MKAFIPAAGLGTRLKPLTNELPKALVPYKGKTLLQITIEKLKKYNFDTLIINVHHFADKIKSYLKENNYFDSNIIISDETDQLLETGGGLFNARQYLNDGNFLIHNVDIISNIDLNEMYKQHLQNNSIATLAVQRRQSNKKLYFNSANYLCKWKNEHTGQEKIARQDDYCTGFAFSGIHFVNPKIFEFMSYGKYSIIDTYLNVAHNNKISFFDHTGDFWRDMGRPESFID